MLARRLFWLLPLLWLSGCGLAPQDVRSLQLELSPTSDFRESFRLDVLMQDSGAFCQGRIRLEGDQRDLARSLSPQEVEAVMRALESEGVWGLKDGDCGDPEECVLYTRLDVDLGSRHSYSRWRGLPPPQARIARALLDSPVAPILQEGLQAVQRRKASLNQQPP